MKAAFYTLGCKANQADTQAMRERLAQCGYDIAESDDIMGGVSGALDVIVVNSCTVTGESDRKVRQLLRRLRRDHPAAIIALTGCMPQAYPQASMAILEADIVLGNRDRAELPKAIERFRATHRRVTEVTGHAVVDPFAEDAAGCFDGRTRAFLKIEDGCARGCAYCIIPKARGFVRSMSLDDLRGRLRAIADRGKREVVFTGINLSSFGQGTDANLADAVEVAEETDGLLRVRLGSLEPDLLPDELLVRLAGCKKLCPQFHLSLQSGCDATLRRMGRLYDTALYRGRVERMREMFPGVAVTTDIMVGFPGEGDDEFEQSVAFAREMCFAKAHVFPFSRREGTAAASMPGQVPEDVKHIRARRMTGETQEDRRTFLRRHVGRTVWVLCETPTDDGAGMLGYAEDYTRVKIQVVPRELIGEVIPVRITEAEGSSCCVGILLTP